MLYIIIAFFAAAVQHKPLHLPDKKNDARRIRRHIFNTDGHLAINATSIKLGDRRYPKDKRVVMKHIHGTEEMSFDA